MSLRPGSKRESATLESVAAHRRESKHDPCYCETDDGEWRPCPPSLCERIDEFHKCPRMSGDVAESNAPVAPGEVQESRPAVATQTAAHRRQTHVVIANARRFRWFRWPRKWHEWFKQETTCEDVAAFVRPLRSRDVTIDVYHGDGSGCDA